jgi:hypothetical protein
MTAGDRGSIGAFGWLWRATFAFAALISLGSWFHGLSGLATKTPASVEALGIGYGPPTVNGTGWTGIDRVEPGGAADTAGLRPGDSIKFEARTERWMPLRPGHRVTVEVDRQGQRFASTIIAQEPKTARGPQALGLALGALQALAMLGIGSLLLLKCPGQRAAALLSAILLVQAASGDLLTMQLPTAAAFPAAVLFNVVLELAIGFAWPMFCLEIAGGKANPRQARVVTLAAAVFALVAAAIRSGELFLVAGYSPLLYPAFVLVHQAFGYGVIALNYHRNDALQRNRIKIVVLAFLSLTVGVVLVNAWPGQWQSIVLGSLRILAGILLAYAIMRQRLFDLNFVLNRTLIYGVISFVLLAGFGLTEWAVKHTLPEAWYKESAIYSAAIALVLFLSLHRLRDWIEHHIERLFFHDWHVNEAALKRFVASAGAFGSAAALCRAFTGELTRFAGGAAAVLYLRDPANRYRRTAGKLAGASAAYGDEERLFALLRTEREPIDLADINSTIPGVLALPMLDQGSLSGFVLIDAKPDGTRFRPDEVEGIGCAAHQVGLALSALNARELAEENRLLGKKVEALAEERDRLLARLSPEAEQLRA